MSNKICEEIIDTAKTLYGDNDIKNIDEVPPCSIAFEELSDENIIDYNENNFNWKKFWTYAKLKFPLHSVHGSKKYDCDYKIFESEQYRCHSQIGNLIKKMLKNKPTCLEIGFGFGGAAHYLSCLGFRYYGIDYVNSIINPDLKNKFNGYDTSFIEIQKNGIPYELNNIQFDLVYSTNVFQHITEKQRNEYYKQVYKQLKNGGIFYFDLFTNNFKPKVNATVFFGVNTTIPSEDETFKKLKGIGFNNIRLINRYRLDDVDNYLTLITCEK